MLFFFRRVYSEVVTAIPVNGGTYNVMLNTSSKKMAAFVACLSMLSYIATAILSAFDAVIYLSLLWPGVGKKYSLIMLCKLYFGAVQIFEALQSLSWHSSVSSPSVVSVNQPTSPSAFLSFI